MECCVLYSQRMTSVEALVDTHNTRSLPVFTQTIITLSHYYTVLYGIHCEITDIFPQLVTAPLLKL